MIDTHRRLASADALKLKCESMPYRSIFEGNTCYFAIHGQVKHDDRDANCSSVLWGAKVRVDRERERVLGLLHLNPSTFHDATTAGQLKNVLCSLEVPFTCDNGKLALPGRCLIRSKRPITWTEASNFCRSKGASGIVIHNAHEDKVVAGLLGKNETGWLLPSRGDVWSAEDQKVDYWKWFFEGQTPADLRCNGSSQHVIITKTAKTDCSVYGPWIVDNSINKNIALCIRDAECPICPKPKEVPKPESTTTSTTTTTVATTTSIAKANPCVPKNDPPRQNDLWNLTYYYNWGRKLHAFSATPEGYKTIQNNGIRYCPKAGFGSLGGTISDEGYRRLQEVCSDPEERKHIVKMWFTKKCLSYQHIFDGSTASKDVYVGYVSIKAGACGSKWPVKRWSCCGAADAMYAVELNKNMSCKGQAQNGGKVHFWLWEMNEKARDAQRKGDCSSTSEIGADRVRNVTKPTEKRGCGRRRQDGDHSGRRHFRYRGN